MGLADGVACENELGGSWGTKIISGQGEMRTTEYGAKRESNEERGRFDLLPYEAIEALAKWYEAGSKKYDERNWEQGISVKDCINRMIRHAMKAGNGWTDEDHLAAVMWNAAAAITMMQRRPDCNDHIWLNNPLDGDDKEPNTGKKYIGKLSKTCDGCMNSKNRNGWCACILDENGFYTGYIPEDQTL